MRIKRSIVRGCGPGLSHYSADISAGDSIGLRNSTGLRVIISSIDTSALRADWLLPYNPYPVRTIRSRTMDDKTERFEMRVTASFLKMVDDWRRRQPELPSRAEAIRRLVELGLKAKR